MTVVVGYVPTPEGEAALDHAVAEARAHNVSLIIVHSSRGGEHEDEQAVYAARDALEDIERRLRADGLDVDVRDIARGNTPAYDLVDVANASDAQLLVIGMRRRSAVGKLLLGSNAQEILLSADCPVLAVKPTTTAW